MSDPVTNVEIEDVLSSIRRLVSDDIRVVKPKPEAVKHSDRLVLTPALRVSEKVPDVGESVKAPVVLTEVAFPVEDVLVEETAEEISENLTDIAPVESADLPKTVDAPASEAHDGTLEQSDFVAGALDDFVEQEVERALSATDLEVEVEVEVEAGEPDVVREELVLQSLVADLAQSESAPVVEEPTADMPEPEADWSNLDLEALDTLAGDVSTRRPAVSDGESLADKIAALEEMVGRSQAAELEQEQPMIEAPVFHRSSDVMDWQDHLPEAEEPAQNEQEEAVFAPDPVQDEIQPEDERLNPDQGQATDAAPDAAQESAMIDEDTLRALVSDMVRQELQGALGERITRNVRKLVRREIHRVLMSQDFD